MAEVERGAGWWKATDGEWYPPRWEYRWVGGYIPHKKPRPDMIEPLLAEAGAQGWEAVSAMGDPSGVSSFYVMVLIKRPVLG